jgi:cytochrome b subunit of formate dehydrogenase
MSLSAYYLLLLCRIICVTKYRYVLNLNSRNIVVFFTFVIKYSYFIFKNLYFYSDSVVDPARIFRFIRIWKVIRNRNTTHRTLYLEESRYRSGYRTGFEPS